MTTTTTTINRAVSSLNPHPLNIELYGDSPPEDLISSIELHGVQVPLSVLEDGTILSGHRRHAAAKQLGLKEVPVIVVDIPDELDQREFIVAANIQRQKSNFQILREAQTLMKVEAERAKLRQSEGGKLKEKIPEGGQSRDKVGKLLNMSGKSVDSCIAIAEYIKKHPQDDDSEILSRLSKGFSGAHKLVKEQQAEEKSHSDQVAASSGIALDDWNKRSPAEKDKFIEDGLEVKSTRMNEQKNASIEWARYSWNPVTGCEHDCSYCYAADISNRFGGSFKPEFHPERLAAPLNHTIRAVKQPSDTNVFVCSMADLFGSWVPNDWVEAVLSVVRDKNDLTFLFLTKNPKALCDYEWPDNVLLGATVDRKERVDPTLRAFERLRTKSPNVRTWLSVEPMLERFEFDSFKGFEVVVIGGCSAARGHGPFQPPSSWVTPLIVQAHQDGCGLFLKTNLGYRPTYMPGLNSKDIDRAPQEYFTVSRKLGSHDESEEFSTLPVIQPGRPPEVANEPRRTVDADGHFGPQAADEERMGALGQPYPPRTVAESRDAVPPDGNTTFKTERNPTAQS